MPQAKHDEASWRWPLPRSLGRASVRAKRIWQQALAATPAELPDECYDLVESLALSIQECERLAKYKTDSDANELRRAEQYRKALVTRNDLSRRIRVESFQATTGERRGKDPVYKGVTDDLFAAIRGPGARPN